ncbi:MAG: hypothetical protein CVT88_05210 [Candidatus Altiarchaeales archaeon HGW-Altiarchaeales-1]|nr:MAG: hypothetical protein CVT89_07210 [Candidatus Altiarchaeales archaeon HGW-Altiarchaeales-2]PKP59557.1 MAG: hypothetical protein CVT88_05210 [Candidatus Altiarchaeales archaeon HGW-Altiarchaeales-1]
MKQRAKGNLPEDFRKYFWDCEFDELIMEKYPKFIAERILCFGNIKEIKWLLTKLNKDMFLKISTTSRRLDERTKNFWKIYFQNE